MLIIFLIVKIHLRIYRFFKIVKMSHYLYLKLFFYVYCVNSNNMKFVIINWFGLNIFFFTKKTFMDRNMDIGETDWLKDKREMLIISTCISHVQMFDSHDKVEKDQQNIFVSNKRKIDRKYWFYVNENLKL